MGVNNVRGAAKAEFWGIRNLRTLNGPKYLYGGDTYPNQHTIYFLLLKPYCLQSMYIYLYTPLYIYIYIYISCVCIPVYIYIYICIYMYVCMYVCMCIYIYAHTHIYIYIYDCAPVGPPPSPPPRRMSWETKG